MTRTSAPQRGVLDYLGNQLLEAHAVMGGEFGHQRGLGHARLGVDLEAGEALDAGPAVVVAEIGAADAAAAERPMRLERQTAAGFSALGRRRRRPQMG